MRRTRSNFPNEVVDTGLGYRLVWAPKALVAATRPLPLVHADVGSFAAMEPASIREIGLFAEFDDQQCTHVANACQELEVEAGTTLTEEGDFGYAMFAVTSGTAEVFKDGDLIRELGPGDVFGEIAVFYGGVRTATVVAKTPMRLVMLFNRELWRLDREVPEVANLLRSTVADRLATS